MTHTKSLKSVLDQFARVNIATPSSAVCITTLKPISLRVMIETTTETENRVILRVKVSPQPKEHKVW